MCASRHTTNSLPIKHLNYVGLFPAHVLAKRSRRKLPAAKSLREVYDLLRGFPLIGDFMAYQIAIDVWGWMTLRPYCSITEAISAAFMRTPYVIFSIA